MPIRYDNPREIGPDRLVNAVAGFEKVGGACVIVDFGTAVTHDVVSADGEYLGGVIFPGLEISLEALTERAAALPTIDLTEPRAVLGKSTVDAIRSGVLYGYAGWSTGSSSGSRASSATDARDRHGRPGRRRGALLQAHRRGRRPAHADRPAAHLGAEPLTSAGSSAIDAKTRAPSAASASGRVSAA